MEIQVPLRRVILESPFAGASTEELEANKRYLEDCLRDSLARGEAPFASHQMYPEALDDSVPAQRQLGIAAGLAWWPGADFVVFYLDRGLSPGMAQALAKCRRESIIHSFRSLHGQAELEAAMAQIPGIGSEPAQGQTESSLKKAVSFLNRPQPAPAAIKDLDNAALIAEYEKWTSKIEKVTSWGAALGAAQEFKQECQREIRRRGIVL